MTSVGFVWALAAACNLTALASERAGCMWRDNVAIAYQATDLPVALFYAFPHLAESHALTVFVYLSATVNGLLGLARAWPESSEEEEDVAKRTAKKSD